MPRFSTRLQELLDQADADVCARTSQNQRWGISEFEDWGLDMDAGLILFTDSRRSGICAPVQVVGSYRLRDSTWLWAWANPSIDERLSLAARKTCEHLSSLGLLSEVAEPRLGDVTEGQAWQLTALAGVVWNATGSYRAPADAFHLFLVYGQLREIAGA